MILKVEISHCVWVEQVPAIEDQRRVHQTPHFGKVNVLELFPFGGDDERLRVSDGLKCRRDQNGVWAEFRLSHFFDSLRIVGNYVRAFPG